jgi:hypothetical protein
VEISFVEYRKDTLGVYKSSPKVRKNLALFVYDILETGSTGIELSKENGKRYFGMDNSNKTIYLDIQTINHNSIISMIKENLEDGINRNSYNFITHRDNSRYYYLLVTIYDGMITVFYNYEKRVSRKIRKDSDTWFNSLPLKK